MKARFTIDGSETLEAHLGNICRRVANDVRQIIPNGELQALLLGGGYGRGHGGVLKSSDGDKPYNDLEFYVCLRGSEVLNRRKYQHDFHELAEKLTPEAGVEVEFKISSVQKLQQYPPTMFAYDLAWGHQMLIGDDTRFLQRSTLHAENIPLFEATRLLMNRCSGLLFAREHLQRKPFTAADADFVGRNHAKAQLGLGDAFLSAHGQYHWDCRVRNERLRKFTLKNNLPWFDEVRRHHSLGLDFKLHPRLTAVPMENLCDRQRELTHLSLKVWLWLESKRLKQLFTSAREYVFSGKNKCPETNSLRNVLVNAKTFKKNFVTAGNPFRYPRERLLHSLSLLLWEPSALNEQELLKKIQADLRTSATTFADLVRAYEALWKNFN